MSSLTSAVTAGVIPLDGSDIWGYGRFGADEILPVSVDDIRRDVLGAVRALQALGLAHRSTVLLLAKVAEYGQSYPLHRAALDLGFSVCSADASAFDVERLAMFARLLSLAAVIGVDQVVLDGLVEAGLDAGAVFGGVGVVLARGSAHRQLCDQLSDLDVAVRRMELIGPALAVECAHGGLHVDGTQWEVVADGGRLLLTSRSRRAHPLRAWDTGMDGSVHHHVCPCGRREPVVVLADGGVGR